MCVRVFEGHVESQGPQYFCLLFASASRISRWRFSSNWIRTRPINFTLEGHDKGVNWVDYFHGGDRPFLISGADDRYASRSGISRTRLVSRLLKLYSEHFGGLLPSRVADCAHELRKWRCQEMAYYRYSLKFFFSF